MFIIAKSQADKIKVEFLDDIIPESDVVVVSFGETDIQMTLEQADYLANQLAFALQDFNRRNNGIATNPHR